MNPVIEKLIAELNKPILGDPWYGWNFEKVLGQIDYRRAFKKADLNVHSIAEIALHIYAWIEEVSSRLEGNMAKLPLVGDWPPVEKETKEYWNEIVGNIISSHKKLIELVKTFPFEDFEKLVGNNRELELGTGLTFREMLVGLMEHNVYHLGQISLLNKILLGKQQKHI